uniref:Uncharacterized protein n=1 Tax=viral metagenome TaxID=1070528 RepID=A0A6C0EJZ8_9ZZZZ
MSEYTDLKSYFKTKQLSFKTTILTNNNFINGTYRITKPGYYKLSEDIVFAPNKNIYNLINLPLNHNVLDNYRPTLDQQNYKFPPYHLGFFAAITIESDDVILDLNEHSISQDKMHYINQRFFSIVELNESPFIKSEGPSDFGKNSFHKYINIKNGRLGLSSHHGIHGNGNKYILIEDLDISNFEVAGIALNGCENCILNQITIHDSVKDTEISFMYSNAISTRFFLKQLLERVENTSITILGKEKKGKEILDRLEKELIENVYIPIQEGRLIQSDFYRNTHKLPEGNIYGIVLNSTGVVINDFLNNSNAQFNKNNILMNITLKNIDSFPKEIITLSNSEIPTVHQGLVGDNIPYLEISDSNNYYKENNLYNAIALIAKYNNNCKCIYNSKSLNVPDFMITEWFGKQTNLLDIKKKYGLLFTNLRDQMNHYMKGNIMLFISGSENVTIKNITMKNINNSGASSDNDETRIGDYKVVAEKKDQVNFPLLFKEYLGNNINPFVLTQSTNVTIENVDCSQIISTNGKCVGIHTINNCSTIKTNNINIIDNMATIQNGLQKNNGEMQNVFQKILVKLIRNYTKSKTIT